MKPVAHRVEAPVNGEFIFFVVRVGTKLKIIFQRLKKRRKNDREKG